MQLLTENQPWNLIIFMAIPVILAETLAITELAILFNRKTRRWIKNLNLYAGLLAGIYFLGIFFYLMKSAVIPLSITGGWRGPADIIAVGFYLAGVIPLFGISLLEIRLLYPLKSSEDRLRVHVILVGTFLILAHVAMIFGMLNPELLGWVNPEPLMTTM